MPIDSLPRDLAAVCARSDHESMLCPNPILQKFVRPLSTAGPAQKFDYLHGNAWLSSSEPSMSVIPLYVRLLEGGHATRWPKLVPLTHEFIFPQVGSCWFRQLRREACYIPTTMHDARLSCQQNVAPQKLHENPSKMEYSTVSLPFKNSRLEFLFRQSVIHEEPEEQPGVSGSLNDILDCNRRHVYWHNWSEGLKFGKALRVFLPGSHALQQRPIALCTKSVLITRLRFHVNSRSTSNLARSLSRSP